VVVALLPAVGAAPEVADSVTRRGSRLSSTWRCFWGMSSTVVGAPCIPLPPTLSGLKTCNATAGCLVRSGRCFTQLRSPTMKVVAAAKIAATSSVVVNVVLVVPLFAADHGGGGGSESPQPTATSKQSAARRPRGWPSPRHPQNLSRCRLLLLLLRPLRRGGQLLGGL
jgi:hypothetical protein